MIRASDAIDQCGGGAARMLERCGSLNQLNLLSQICRVLELIYNRPLRNDDLHLHRPLPLLRCHQLLSRDTGTESVRQNGAQSMQASSATSQGPNDGSRNATSETNHLATT